MGIEMGIRGDEDPLSWSPENVQANAGQIKAAGRNNQVCGERCGKRRALHASRWRCEAGR